MSKRISKAGNIKYALSGDDDFIASVLYLQGEQNSAGRLSRLKLSRP
ncbi:MAG TPA: hypothetical protein VNS33_14430 [Bradyrhizobium sp.]|jgi:hypothetical protein|nr:hypothetical protein [Bradyrhizobium sp.]